ncbi:MAG: hypothetical protein ACI9BN_001319 [Francisella sp.]|jgi:hypothetical protein
MDFLNLIVQLINLIVQPIMYTWKQMQMESNIWMFQDREDK